MAARLPGRGNPIGVDDHDRSGAARLMGKCGDPAPVPAIPASGAGADSPVRAGQAASRIPVSPARSTSPQAVAYRDAGKCQRALKIHRRPVLISSINECAQAARSAEGEGYEPGRTSAAGRADPLGMTA
jgi:hypothetical protein